MATRPDPLRRSDPPAPKSGEDSGIPSRGRALRDMGYGRAVRWGLVASLLFHLVLVLWFSRLLEIGALAWDAAFPQSGPIPDAIEVLDVREVADRPPLIFPEAPLIDPARRPPSDAPVGVDVPETTERRGLTNAERLQPRPGDMRLWRDWRGRPLDYRLRGLARGDSALLAAIDRLYDALGLNEQERRTLDWLLETEGGKKWGITPEAIYLGTITLPNIFNALFQPMGPVGRDMLQQARDRSAIDQQDIETHWGEIVEERQRQIRARSQAEIERRRREEEQQEEEAARDSVTAE